MSAWKTEFDVPAPEPETAIVPVGAPIEQEDSEYSQPSSSSDDEADIPAGPIDPERCTIGGPGFQGGAAQASVTFYVTAKDARGTRIREGGAYVVVKVTPGSSARAAGAEVVVPDVRDVGDGTYNCTYCGACARRLRGAAPKHFLCFTLVACCLSLACCCLEYICLPKSCNRKPSAWLLHCWSLLPLCMCWTQFKLILVFTQRAA